MQVRAIKGAQVEVHPAPALAGLLADPEGLVWVDLDAEEVGSIAELRDVVGLDPLTVQACLGMQRLPLVRTSERSLFLVLHAPEPGQGGRVYHVELDQFIGPRFLVTVHGPLDPDVRREVAIIDTEAVWGDVRDGQLRPQSPAELSHAIVSSMTRRVEGLFETLTRDIWSLEQRATLGHHDNPEEVVQDLFTTRQILVALEAMTGSSAAVLQHGLQHALAIPAGQHEFLASEREQFHDLHALARSQREYLEGVIEFQTTAMRTKARVAEEKLALIAVVTLPITALADLFGMRMIVSQQTDLPVILVLVVVMLALSGTLLAWARRKGWW